MPPGKRNISEDDPRWDPRTMGNKKYGPGASIPSNAGGTHKPAGRGTGPGPKGSYPNLQRAAGKRLAEDSAKATWVSGKGRKKVTGPLSNMNYGKGDRRVK
jgi:hypothetical protein